MRYERLNPELFIENRARLAAQLTPNAIAVLTSNDIMPTSADGTMGFRQNPDLFYLSGVDQEESVLVLFPDARESKHREVLFLKETSEHIAIWDGQKLSKDDATQLSGIETVLWTSSMDAVMGGLILQADTIYLNTNEHARMSSPVETRQDRLRKEIQAQFPLHRYERLAPVMADLRSVKSEHEIVPLQTACDITDKGFRRVLGFTKPGVMEYEIEAEYIHEFTRAGATGFAYTPIIATGANACVLHYIENDCECKDGDMLLMDVGAEYANYNADMTRSIPVNGRFSDRQRDVYNAVHRVFTACYDLLRPGVLINDYQKEVQKLVESELIGLKLLDADAVKNQDKKNPLFKKYFMHGTSHHLGLDVHDVGHRWREVQEGMVFTVEPGIYIREEDLGIRLENDIVVGKESSFDLMRNIPIEIEEIEDLMNAKV